MFSLLVQSLKEKRLGKKLEEVSCDQEAREDHTEAAMESTPVTIQQSANNEEKEEIHIKFGVISEIFDGVLVIKILDEDRVETLPCNNDDTMFIVNDKVKLSCIIEEEGFDDSKSTWRIKNIEPSTQIEEKGKVTMLHEKFVELDNRVIFLKSSSADESFELNQLCQYIKIETSQEIDVVDSDSSRKTYGWRVWKFISTKIPKIISKPQAVKRSTPTVQTKKSDVSIETKNFTVRKSSTEVLKQFLHIKNGLDGALKFTKIDLKPSNPEIVKLDLQQRKKFIVDLKPFDGKFKVFFQIFPRKAGKFDFTAVATFETTSNEKLERKCEFSIEIQDNDELRPPRRNDSDRFTDVRIRYESTISDELRCIGLKRFLAASEELAETYPLVVEKEITEENFCEKIEYGIHLEEIALEQAFAAYRVKETVFEEKGKYLRILVKDVAEKRPSIVIGDAVIATPCDALKNQALAMSARGRIVKVEQDAVIVEFAESFRETHNDKKFSIDFDFSRTTYRYQQHALKEMMSKFGNSFIFPKPKVLKHPQFHATLSQEGKLMIHDKERAWFDKQLNHRQKIAVVNALRGEIRPVPFVIYGPPGTGKTKTVIEVVTQIFTMDPSSHIIIATPSNSAANIFTEAFMNSKHFNGPHDFVRFVSQNQMEKNLIPDYLTKFCATIRTSSDNGEQNFEPTYSSSGVRQGCTRTHIMNYRICIGTLHSMGDFMKIKFPDDHFKFVIIDEAGQAREAGTFQPIVSLSKHFGQVILAGDPLQLGPISHSRLVKEFKLDLSMLERLLRDNECYKLNDQDEYDPRYVTKLDINYRSTPSVLSIYNNLFYKGKLEGNIKENNPETELPMILSCNDILWATPEKNEKCGVYFVDVVKGKNRRIPENSSWYNDAEMSSIISFMNKLTAGIKYPFKDIGIITPYALQVKKLKEKVSYFSDTDLKIGTVEDFQGQERKIILLSTVRTDEKLIKVDQRLSLGFLQCEKRINVALSRARSLLIIFGKGEVLKTDLRWREVINFTKENGTFVVDDRT